GLPIPPESDGEQASYVNEERGRNQPTGEHHGVDLNSCNGGIDRQATIMFPIRYPPHLTRSTPPSRRLYRPAMGSHERDSSICCSASAAWVRVRTPSLRNMAVTWALTVASDTCNS